MKGRLHHLAERDRQRADDEGRDLDGQHEGRQDRIGEALVADRRQPSEIRPRAPRPGRCRARNWASTRRASRHTKASAFWPAPGMQPAGHADRQRDHQREQQRRAPPSCRVSGSRSRMRSDHLAISPLVGSMILAPPGAMRAALRTHGRIAPEVAARRGRACSGRIGRRSGRADPSGRDLPRRRRRAPCRPRSGGPDRPAPRATA